MPASLIVVMVIASTVLDAGSPVTRTWLRRETTAEACRTMQVLSGTTPDGTTLTVTCRPLEIAEQEPDPH